MFEKGSMLTVVADTNLTEGFLLHKEAVSREMSEMFRAVLADSKVDWSMCPKERLGAEKMFFAIARAVKGIQLKTELANASNPLAHSSLPTRRVA